MITLHIYFCHTELQAKRTIEIVRNGKFEDHYLIFSTCKHGVFAGIERYDKINPQPLPVGEVQVVDEKTLGDNINFALTEILAEDSAAFPGLIIEVDITNARPPEAFAICWVSAAIDLRAYTQTDPGAAKRYMESVPPFVPLTENENTVIACFGGPDRWFTSQEANAAIGGDLSLNDGRRATKALADRHYLETSDRERTRRPGRIQHSYHVTSEGDYMGSMNARSRRAAEKQP